MDDPGQTVDLINLQVEIIHLHPGLPEAASVVREVVVRPVHFLQEVAQGAVVL
jgi:hypothetical protein